MSIMKVAIVGLRGCGKTTIFKALCKTKKITSNVAIVKVADKRLDLLYNLYKPKRKVFSEIEFIEVFWEEKALSFLRNIDVITLVINCFEGEKIPEKDADKILQELFLSDLLIIEKRISSLKGFEKILLERCKKGLLEEQPIGKLGLNKEEEKLLSSYQFLTNKPIVIVGNIGEGDLLSEKIERLKAYTRIKDVPLVIICGKFEMDLIELNEKEKDDFRKGLEIEDGIANLIKVIYNSMGLISFFTGGKEEVRAWTIPKGTNATKAAGKIHSDMERGFIKASVISYEDLINCGSIKDAKEKGKVKIEGKDYIVKDGDIIEFRFNV